MRIESIQGGSRSALHAFETELGAQAPLGFYDPLGVLDTADQAQFDRLRGVELKHGRVCMLAFVGNLATRGGYHLDGNIDYAGHSFASFPDGWAAIKGPESIPTGGVLQIVAFCGVLELAIMKDLEGTGNEFVGDFRNGGLDFGWDKFNDFQKKQKRAIELNNGRAAQFGILGLMMHEQLGGTIPVVGDMGPGNSIGNGIPESLLRPIGQIINGVSEVVSEVASDAGAAIEAVTEAAP